MIHDDEYPRDPAPRWLSVSGVTFWAAFALIGAVGAGWMLAGWVFG